MYAIGMVYGPLGYWGALNVGGIILQLVGFIMLLSQFQKWIKKAGRKLGDSNEEIRLTKNMATKWGIYFVIIGTASQLIAALLNAYWPNFLSDQP